MVIMKSYVNLVLVLLRLIFIIQSHSVGVLCRIQYSSLSVYFFSQHKIIYHWPTHNIYLLALHISEILSVFPIFRLIYVCISTLLHVSCTGSSCMLCYAMLYYIASKNTWTNLFLGSTIWFQMTKFLTASCLMFLSLALLQWRNHFSYFKMTYEWWWWCSFYVKTLCLCLYAKYLHLLIVCL